MWNCRCFIRYAQDIVYEWYATTSSRKLSFNRNDTEIMIHNITPETLSHTDTRFSKTFFPLCSTFSGTYLKGSEHIKYKRIILFMMRCDFKRSSASSVRDFIPHSTYSIEIILHAAEKSCTLTPLSRQLIWRDDQRLCARSMRWIKDIACSGTTNKSMEKDVSRSMCHISSSSHALSIESSGAEKDDLNCD